MTVADSYSRQLVSDLIQDTAHAECQQYTAKHTAHAEQHTCIAYNNNEIKLEYERWAVLPAGSDGDLEA